MRLLQITASTVWRGHEQKIIYLYEAFEEKKYFEEQYIVCPFNTPVHEVAEEKNMKVIGFDYKGEYDFRFAKELAKIVREKQIDVVFIHSSKAHTLAVLSHLLFGLNAPLVLCRTLIRRVDSNFFRKWKYNYKGIKKIICVSNPVVDVLKYAVKDHSKMCVVGSVTDIHKFNKTVKTGMLHREFNIPQHYKIIGNIAEFTGFKDHRTWINTVEILVKERKLQAAFILVGQGELEGEIRQLARERDWKSTLFLQDSEKMFPKFYPSLICFYLLPTTNPPEACY